jgi:hypothetical protein
VIADPVLFRPGSKEFSPRLMRIFMPFSQLLQTPVNLAPLDERLEIFSAWNPRLWKHILPKLVQFVFSVANYREKPNYPPPQDFEVTKALSTVLGLLSANFQKFKQEFNRVSHEFHPIGWSLAAFIPGFFEEAAEDPVGMSTVVQDTQKKWSESRSKFPFSFWTNGRWTPLRCDSYAR